MARAGATGDVGFALVFLVIGLVLLLLLPSPWNLIVLGACLVLFIGELAFWNRTGRHRGAQTGLEAYRASGISAPSGAPLGTAHM